MVRKLLNIKHVLMTPRALDQLELDLRRMQNVYDAPEGADTCIIAAFNSTRYPLSFDFRLDYVHRDRSGAFERIGEPVRINSGTLHDVYG